MPDKKLLVAIGILGFGFTLNGCGSQEFKSHWREREVTIDGRNTEWSGFLSPLDDKGTSAGVLNDDKFLYLAIVTSNPQLQRQINRLGLTVWFDQKGGEDKKFGIHYPVGIAGFERRNEAGDADEPAGREPEREAAQNASSEVEIIGPSEADRHEMTLAETGGIEARFNQVKDTLVYELKVPLRDDGTHPFAIGTTAGATIGIGAETVLPQAVRQPSEGSMEGGRGGGYGGRGGFGGRGGRGGRGGGFGGRSPSGSRPEPFNAWAKVTLASPGATAQ